MRTLPLLLLLAACSPSTFRCYPIDGDTLDCEGERVRLNGIDAPERSEPGSKASTAALDDLVYNQPVLLHRFKQDRYGRTVAQAVTTAGDLSCIQLRNGHASYIPRWDEEWTTARSCLASARMS